jgi:transcriptional regulator with XRE-family HTH domain
MKAGIDFKVLGKSLERARKDLGLSRVELARRIGTSDSVVYLMETGKYNPTMLMLDRYAKGLGVRIEIGVWLTSKHKGYWGEE